MSVVIDDVSVHFGGLNALSGISLGLERGAVEAVIGPNGAGKTTLLNVLSGHIPPSSGTITLGGADITKLATHERAKAGISRSFQTPRFIPYLSVRENILVGCAAQEKAGLLSTIFNVGGQARREREVRELADEAIEAFRLGDVADHIASDVPLWQLRMMEIARCMVSKPQYVLLDEPAAGFDEVERDLLAEQVRALAESGVGVVLVEHNFGFIKSVSSHVTVLAQGSHLASGSPLTIEEDPKVVETYLGAEEH